MTRDRVLSWRFPVTAAPVTAAATLRVLIRFTSANIVVRVWWTPFRVVTPTTGVVVAPLPLEVNEVSGYNVTLGGE